MRRMPVPVTLMLRIRSPSQLALGGVEAGGRLVEQEDLRVGGAGPGDGHELALALAEVTGLAVAQVGDADEVERTLHGAVRGRALDAEGGGADVLLDAEVVVELERLEGTGEAAAHPLVGLAARRCRRRRAATAARRPWRSR